MLMSNLECKKVKRLSVQMRNSIMFIYTGKIFLHLSGTVTNRHPVKLQII